MNSLKAADGASLLTLDYRQAVALQNELVTARQRGDTPDGVWYLEHQPVVTWNPGRGQGYLLHTPQALRDQGVEVEPCDRGGDVTFHGPGQLIGYPIVYLGDPRRPSRDLHAYLRALEEALMVALASWTIESCRSDGRTGVWTPVSNAASAAVEAKIAAIGVRVRKWVTCHGFALNVTCDLAPFRELIVPCGISDAGVTSMREVLGESAPQTLRTSALVDSVHGALEASLGRPLAKTFNGKDWCSDA